MPYISGMSTPFIDAKLQRAIEAVESVTKVTKSQIVSRSRIPHIVQARYFFYLLAREQGIVDRYTAIFVGRNVSAVPTACSTINDTMRTYPEVGALYEQIKQAWISL